MRALVANRLTVVGIVVKWASMQRERGDSTCAVELLLLPRRRVGLAGR